MTALLRLLGQANLETTSDSAVLPSERASWLIAYLGVRDDWVARDDLAALFWSDAEPDAARNSLRQLLHRVRRLGWAEGLEADAQGVRWAADCDVRQFRRAMAAANWAEAVQVYRGALLEGQHLHGLPDLEHWLDGEREDLQAAWRDAALGHAAELEQTGNHPAALELLERLIHLDPYAEETLIAFVRCAVQGGQRDRAAWAYDAFKRQLIADLGLEPSEDTGRTIESLLRSQTPDPAQMTQLRRGSLVGREDELALIATQLADPHCRMLTLTGPGGVGKTRLALQATDAARAVFADGAFFVPLAALESHQQVPASIAEAIGLTLQGKQDPTTQVLAYLRNRDVLLALDNFEHLLEGATAIPEWLEAAPRLKLLVTSRERLDISEERLMPIVGLPYPERFDLEAARRSSAVRLFVERAARTRAGFALSAEDAPGVVRICQLTEGLPLALELAAVWAGALSPEAIAQGIEDCLDFLSDTDPDLPERHRSLRATFEHSWGLLSHEEQHALEALSVFRGGFDRRAANAVAEVSPRHLVSLINKSLLRSAPSGRFELLEVLRQHAASKLEPARTETLRAAHSAHYLTLAETIEPKLLESDQARWLTVLDLEHANLRSVFDHTSERHPELALRLANALPRFWTTRGHPLEGFGLLQRLLAHPNLSQVSTQVLAEADYAAGSLARHLGRLPEAKTLLEDGLNRARANQDRKLERVLLFELGIVERSFGNLDAATRHTTLALTMQRTDGDRWGEAQSQTGLGIIAALQGHKAEAAQHWTQGLEIAREIGDRRSEAGLLENLGLVAPDVAQARDLFLQSLAIKRELQDQSGIGHSLTNLGGLELDAGHTAAALEMLREAAQVFITTGQELKAAHVLAMLAQVEALLHRYQRALQFAAAARVAYEHRQAKPVPEVLANLDQLEATASAAIGSRNATHWLQQGYATGLQQAITDALQEPAVTFDTGV